MKRERLDKILLRLGYVTEEQVRQALLRQRSRGGRLGSNLLYFRFLSQDQLARALAEQFGVPCYDRRLHGLNVELARQLPEPLLRQLGAIPVGYDETRRALLVAASDPEDGEALQQLKLYTKAREVQACVAPEATLRLLLDEIFHEDPGSVDQIIDLPDLFDDEDVPPDRASGSVPPVADDPDAVLLVSRTPFLKSFLPGLFEREGTRLSVHDEPEELARSLRAGGHRQILVDQASLRDFSVWLKEGRIPAPRGEITVMGSVSAALLDNPVPYDRMMASLMGSLEALVRYRCARAGWTPPYDLICQDLRALARSMGLRRLATDGLAVAAHLLLSEDPHRAAGGARTGRGAPLVLMDFDESLELATALRFPWDVPAVLRGFLELISEIRKADEPSGSSELFLASQALALVWYRHALFLDPRAEVTDQMASVRSALRDVSDRLASSSLIEQYIRIMEEAGECAFPVAGRQALLIGPDDEGAGQFLSHLGRAGYRTVHVTELEEAMRLCERRAPSVVVLNHDAFPRQSRSFKRAFGNETPIVFYAYTQETTPALVLDLLDAGYSDVFAPPFHYEVVTTRITKALQQRHASDVPRKEGSFSASFEAFSFIELVQALGQSRKTMRIDLTSVSGATARIHLREGQMVYAECGAKRGEEAVYAVIAWGEEGSFTAEPSVDCPTPNVQASNDSILLEGCRLLDEAVTSPGSS